MKTSKKPPMFENQYMAHALGGFHGREYLNCEEGLEHFLKKGVRYFETDLSLTDDDVLVCAHGWDRYNCKKVGMAYQDCFEHMTGKLFAEQTISGLHTMTAEKLYAYMCRYPDMCLELDLRELGREQSVKLTEKLVETFQHNADVLNRCLVQVYTFDMHKAINSVYKFPYYQYIVRDAIDKLDSLILKCRFKKICALAVRRTDITPERMKKIKKAGLYALAYTADSPELAKEFFDMGVDTLCSNYLYPGASIADLTQAVVIYNSTPGARETLSEYFPAGLIERRMWETAGHSFEYKTRMQLEKGDGCLLLPCMFIKEGYSFAGWEVKCKSDGSWFWLYEDGAWHSKDEFAKSDASLKLMRFADEAMVMEKYFPEDGKIFLVACWEKIAD